MELSQEILPARVLTPSIPGGPARQYRVQVKDESEYAWHAFATFPHQGPAQACLKELQSRGIISRMLAIRILPTSA